MTATEAGRVLGERYRLIRLIARGGMAAVWEADDTRLSRRVAVKILDPHHAGDEAHRARFRREAIAAAGLAHPGIVATYDTGDDDGVAYIVMELVDGPTLRDVLASRGRLSVGEAASIAVQIADALTFAHEHGLVHRDVKPANVLIQRDGRVKVTDFGIAKAAADGDLTRAGSVIGTARYLSPEQIGGEAARATADVYSLGLVLYEMLAGRLPFTGDTEVAAALARLHAEPPRLSTVRDDVAPGLDDAVARALARDVAHRFPSAAALRAAVAPYASGPADSTAALALSSLTGAGSGTGTAGGATGGAEPTAAALAFGSARAAYADATVASAPTARAHDLPVAAIPVRHGNGAVWLVAFVLFAVGVAAGFLGVRHLQDGTDPPRSPTAPTTAAAAGPVPIASVSDFDPLGDGHEKESRLPALTDGDPSTAWETERYDTPDLGGKAGVGLQVRLSTERPVLHLDAVGPDAGWAASLYVGDRPWTAAPAGPAAATATGVAGTTRFTLARPSKARHLLLWITRVPADGKLHLTALVAVG